MANSNGRVSNETNNNEIYPTEAIDFIRLMKHPLQYTWTLWYFELDRSKRWEECNHQIASFDTVEDFWSLFQHIKSVPELKVGSDYSLFKQGIRPMWEDVANINGGRWLISLDKKHRSSELKNYWLETLLCMIGEGFDDCSDEICGAVVNVRAKQDKLGLWTKDAKNSHNIIAIGQKLKSRLNIPPHMTIGYQIHNESKERSCSMAKNNYVI